MSEPTMIPVMLERDGTCPFDPEFEHRFYFGCVPTDFNERIGKSKRHRQTRHTCGPLAPSWQHEVWLWDGGCDAAGKSEAARKALTHGKEHDHE